MIKKIKFCLKIKQLRNPLPIRLKMILLKYYESFPAFSPKAKNIK